MDGFSVTDADSRCEETVSFKESRCQGRRNRDTYGCVLCRCVSSIDACFPLAGWPRGGQTDPECAMHLLDQHAVELLGLRDSTREAIEDETVVALGCRDVILDNANHLRGREGGEGSASGQPRGRIKHVRKHGHCPRHSGVCSAYTAPLVLTILVYPFLQRRQARTISSETSPPDSMTDFAFFPMSVPGTMQRKDHAQHRTRSGPGTAIGA
eukprot:scaffold9491_cov150-Isochrysis_galbana.AAC.2